MFQAKLMVWFLHINLRRINYSHEIFCSGVNYVKERLNYVNDLIYSLLIFVFNYKTTFTYEKNTST